MSYDREVISDWLGLWDQARKSPEFQSKVSEDWQPLAEIVAEDYDKSPNPVYPDSIGKDQDQPKPSWVKKDLLDQVVDLKNKLYDLEVKLNKEDSGNGEWVEKCHHPKTDPIMSQIEKMRKQIDDLSNSLGKEDETAISQYGIPKEGE